MRAARFLLPLTAYLLSLCFPALLGPGQDRLAGFPIGLSGLFAVPHSFAWFTNPIWLTSWIALVREKWRASLWLASAAIAISLDTFRLQRFMIDEAGHSVPLKGVGAGFFLWEAAFVLTALLAWQAGRDARLS